MARRSRTSIHIPQYLHHKSTNTARVRIAGKEHSLGRYGSPSSYKKYDQLIAEWKAAGCPAHTPHRESTIGEIILAYWDANQSRYKPNSLGRPMGAFRALRDLYDDTPVSEFGPRALKSVRDHIDREGGLCRREVNARLSHIKRLFKWATSEELIEPSIYQALATVEGFRRGRSESGDNPEVRPVAVEHVEAIRPFVSRQVWAIIRLQLLTGARGGEILVMKPRMIDTTGKIWLYSPEEHKTAHHGHTRQIYIGPRGQEELRPFLVRNFDAYCFSPAEAEAERRHELHANRSTPISCGNRPGTNRRASPKKSAGDHYTADSYRRAIQNACDMAFPPPDELARKRVPGKKGDRWETAAEWKKRLGADRWNELQAWRKSHRWHPHQLRHTAATFLRKEFGLETARIILGHRSAAITEEYAERDKQHAMRVMEEIG